MSRTLVVCDNEYLKLLYCLNLEVYLATTTTMVSDFSQAEAALKKKDKFDLIVTIATINKEASYPKISSLLNAYGLKIPLIVCGTLKEEVLGENSFGVPEKFNLSSVLKLCAKILNITAKQMAELDIGHYYPVPILPLKNLSLAPCMIYEKNGQNYTALVNTDAPLDDLLHTCEVQDIEHVYVRSNERLTMINKISLALIENISKNMRNMQDAPLSEKVNALNDGFEFAAANIFSTEEIKGQLVEMANAASALMKDVARENTSMKNLLAAMLNNRNGYVFTHSMLTSYVAFNMIKNVSWGGESQLEKINFVLFFHDIFLAPIYQKFPQLTREEALLDCELLDEKEKDIVLNHANLAAGMVVAYKKCPMGADVLIKQHHGMKKGKGFARMYMEDLSPLSKVILVAEKFVEELLSLPPEKMSMAKPIIISRLVSQFKSPSYTKMAQSLATVPI